jgi:small subunit ribosomal protein S4
MGKPKFSRKKYETPSHPWQEDRIKAENELTKKYGLKNKREIWKAETKLRNYRGQAREFSAKISTGDAQSKKESDQLLMSLSRMNILKPNSTLDDVLALNTESILSRRLQTLTYLKGLANTPNQARQLISHGHIAIANRKVTIPGYMVTKDEEDKISYIAASPLNDTMHPARPRADFKSVPIKREEKKPEGAPTEPKKKEKTEKPAEKPPEEKPSEPTEEADKEEKPTEEPPKVEEQPTEEAPKTEEEKPVEEQQTEEPSKEETSEPEKAEEKPEQPVEPPKEEIKESKKQETEKPSEPEETKEDKTGNKDKSEENKEGGQ